MNENSINIVSVEQPLEESVVQKIDALWDSEDAVVPDKEERLSEIVALAWAGESLAGIASTAVIHHEGIDKPLFILRALVGSPFRLQGVVYELYRYVVELVEARFDSGEDTRAIGVFVEVEAEHIHDMKEIPCSFSHDHSVQKRPVQFNLVSITDRGFPQYIYYFENASLFADGPVIEERENKLAPEPGTSLSFCWNKLSSAEQQQIMGLWISSGVITDREACLRRLPQVAALAREDDQIVAVASIFQTPYEAAKANLMGFRSFVSPDAKGSYIATKLLSLVYEEFNKTYTEDPALKDIHGIAYLLQNDSLNKNVRMARGPDVASCLAGYIDKLQLRIKYFDGANIKIVPQG